MQFTYEFCLAVPRITDLQRLARNGDICAEEESELADFKARFGDEIEELDRLDAVSDARCDSDDTPFMQEDVVWPY